MEQDIGDLGLDILFRKTKLDSDGVDFRVAELLLKGIRLPGAVGEIDAAAVTEQWGVHCPLQVSG